MDDLKSIINEFSVGFQILTFFTQDLLDQDHNFCLFKL